MGSITSTPTGTRLTFWMNSPDASSSQQLLSSDKPELYPVLTDPKTQVAYRVTTWRSSKGAYCVCSQGSWLTKSSVKPMDAAYAPLPDGLTQVVVSMPGEKGSVTVPVTR